MGCTNCPCGNNMISGNIGGCLHSASAGNGGLGSRLLADGDPSFSHIALKIFASSFADEQAIRSVWEETLRRSPMASTLRKCTEFDARLAIV